MQHVGVLLGKYHEWGPNYGRGTYSKTGYTVLGPYHATRMEFEKDEVTGKTRPTIDHGCYGFFPGPTGLLSDEPAAERWALEFGVAMTFVELRFGLNPLAPIFNVQDEPTPAGPEPAPARPAPATPGEPAPSATASAARPPADDAPRTYGGQAKAPTPPPAPPAPPPPPPVKRSPVGPSAAEQAAQDVQPGASEREHELPDTSGPSEDERQKQGERREPPPAPSDER